MQMQRITDRYLPLLFERSRALTRETVSAVWLAAEIAGRLEHDGPAQATPRSQHERYFTWS